MAQYLFSSHRAPSDTSESHISQRWAQHQQALAAAWGEDPPAGEAS